MLDANISTMFCASANRCVLPWRLGLATCSATAPEFGYACRPRTTEAELVVWGPRLIPFADLAPKTARICLKLR